MILATLVVAALVTGCSDAAADVPPPADTVRVRPPAT
ncbi:DUF2599 domain-containing protein, partial [Nonomuraea aridisoli]